MKKLFYFAVSIFLLVLSVLAIVVITSQVFAYAESEEVMTVENVVEESTLPFQDVKPERWYYDDVAYVYEHGIMYGVSEDSFAPNSDMTASAVICTLGRIEGIEPAYNPKSHGMTRQGFCIALYWYLTEYKGYELKESTDYFGDDYDIAGFARQSVYALKEIGVVCGYDNGTFCPDRIVTRAEAAAMLHRMCEWMEQN